MSESATIKLSKNLKKIAKCLDGKILKIAGKRIAFTLIIFTDNRVSYISTCSRKESIREMETLLKLWREGMPDIKAHEVN